MVTGVIFCLRRAMSYPPERSRATSRALALRQALVCVNDLGSLTASNLLVGTIVTYESFRPRACRNIVALSPDLHQAARLQTWSCSAALRLARLREDCCCRSPLDPTGVCPLPGDIHALSGQEANTP